MTHDSAPVWRRSSLCNADACVEVARVDGVRTVLMRDSKLDDASPVLAFAGQRFADFVAGVRLGEFD
jgi:Domain of unknown function (DUF397)